MLMFKLIHLFSVVVWLGGMFFAYFVLRPSALAALQVPERLRLWDQVFTRFFNWVWIATFLLLVSGLYQIYQSGGFLHMPHFVYLMLVLGVAMMLIFFYIFFGLYVQFNLAVSAKKWDKAELMLARMRPFIAVNLCLGALVMMIAFIGKSL